IVLWSYLLQAAITSIKYDTNLLTHGTEIRQHIEHDSAESPSLLLWHLNEMRLLDSHATSTKKDQVLNDAYASLGIDEAQIISGYGIALDQVYDSIIDELKMIEEYIRKAAIDAGNTQ
ncbi:MAG: hypothetical protein AB8C13_08170, partial [Phycisphaerales bacterium]